MSNEIAIRFNTPDERVAWDRYVSGLIALAAKQVPPEGTPQDKAIEACALVAAKFADAMLHERRRRYG